MYPRINPYKPGRSTTGPSDLSCLRVPFQRARISLVASQSVDAEAGAGVQEFHARDAGGVFRPAASHGDELAEGLRGEGHRRHGASMQEAARGQRQPLRGGR